MEKANRMTSVPIEQWKKDERAPLEGWDFSYLKGRRFEEQPPWDYKIMAKELVIKSKAVLDMGTGGGEVFSKFAPFPPHTIAIEGYPPNVEVARRRLEPLGVKVREVNESYDLPFTDGEFDAVLNRHSAFKSSEVFRILRRSGTFLTQQVGGSDGNDLVKCFDAVPQFGDWTLDTVKKEVEKAGFNTKEAKEWIGKVEFGDVGAVVYYLKAIPWAVKDFSVDKNLKHLLRLQQKVDDGERLIFTQVRFLIYATK